MKPLIAMILMFNLQACSVLAVADAAGSAVVDDAKTAIKMLDADTPDIVNKKK